MTTYIVYNDLTAYIAVEAPDSNHAVRIARDTPLEAWKIGDHDEVWVTDLDGADVTFDWTEVENLWGAE